jgi:hypothetical protein
VYRERKRGGKGYFRQDDGEKDLAYLTEVVDWRRAPNPVLPEDPWS